MSGLRVVYIAGMPHSGTTLLDLICGTSGRALSLGELRQIAQKQRRGNTTGTKLCSCGQRAHDCAFWGPIIPRIAGMGGAEAYKAILAHAAEFLGPEGVVIDSSKTLGWMSHTAPYDPLVLYMSKDLRSFLVSQIDRAAQKDGARPVGRRWRYRFDETMRWWRHAKNARAMTAAQGLRQLNITYEGLCFDLSGTAARINAAFGSDLVDPEAPIGSGQHHILAGNRMRHSHNGQIRYDARWFGRRDRYLPYALIRPARKLNEARYAP